MKRGMLLLMLSASCMLMRAQSIKLDSTFGVNGSVQTMYAGEPTEFYASAIQADGKIVAVGTTGGNRDFLIARYHPDGSIDYSFSGDGLLAFDFGKPGGIARSVVIQLDGKIVVAGGAIGPGSIDVAVARINPDGSFDNSFSGDGKVLTDVVVSFNEEARAVVLQPDGKIVIAGTGLEDYARAGLQFLTIRYNPDGTLDTSFGGDGIVFTPLSGVEIATALLLQPDGKIVVAGSKYTGFLPFNSNIVIVRYNPDGSFDNSFGGDGYVETNLGRAENIAAAILQADGKIVVAGSSFTPILSDILVARYNSDGSLDNSFSGDGALVMDLGSTEEGFNALELQLDGKIIAGGRYFTPGLGDDYLLMRLLADGTPDNSFGSNGVLITDFTGSDAILSLNLWGNRLYAAGYGSAVVRMGLVAAYVLSSCNDFVATIPDAKTLNTGVDPNTVYTGYTPASDLTLSVQVSGGAPGYNYLWSNGSMSTSITVTPAVTTVYTVTVTDAAGCSKSASKLVNVVDVRCGNKLDKVLVCKSPSSNEICVSPNAVPAQLAGGGYLGNCKHKTEKLLLTASPNPSKNAFTLNFSSKSAAELVVWDATGKLIERRSIVPGIIRLGENYHNGIYLVQLRQGGQIISLKLVKSN